MATLNIYNETNIGAKGIHGQGVHKPVICIDTGEVFASLTDAAEHVGSTIYSISNAVRGKQKTANGLRFCYLSRATEHLDALTTQISKLNADAEDARKWREYQAELEAARKAEEDRIRAEQERLAAIERAREKFEADKRKLEEKLERRNVRIEAIQEQLRQAIERRDETARELDELNEIGCVA